MSLISQKKTSLPKISIGMPVFNGEKFLCKSLDSMLNQTHRNFELIISDNASTDSTSDICKEYSKKDKRIRYFRQKKNMGLQWNYNFVLNKAKFDYFMWSAVDDIHAPKFIEKNLAVINSRDDLVCSMSKVKFYGMGKITQKPDKIDSTYRNFRDKIQETLRPRGMYPISGEYEKKVRFFLNKSMTWMIFGVYRAEDLRRSSVYEQFVGIDLAMILNLLRRGDVYIVDEVLMDVFNAGISNKGIISYSRLLNSGIFGMLFPIWPLTSWCFRNLGPKIFLKNLDYFIVTNLWTTFHQMMDLLRIFAHKTKN